MTKNLKEKVFSCPRKFLTLISISVLTIYPIPSSAWWDVGHKVIAKIAYDHLTPKAKARANVLLSEFVKEYPEKQSFVDLASWPDELRQQKIETFTHWHYIDKPFSNDNTPLKNIIDTDNAVWAITQIKIILQNPNARPIEQARFLAFLIHIVGDLHQPLHTVSRISAAHPDGDRGGNLFFVQTNSSRLNLHALWDSGFGFFDKNAALSIEQRAQTITNRFPETFFINQTQEANPDVWVAEGMSIAKEYVYNTEENRQPKSNYIVNGKDQTQQRAALAGYRLATILNKLLG